MTEEVDTRHRILSYIADFKKAHGYAPVFREIQEECGLASKSTVAFHLDRLEADGLIRRRKSAERYTPRAIEILKPRSKW